MQNVFHGTILKFHHIMFIKFRMLLCGVMILCMKVILITQKLKQCIYMSMLHTSNDDCIVLISTFCHILGALLIFFDCGCHLNLVQLLHGLWCMHFFVDCVQFVFECINCWVWGWKAETMLMFENHARALVDPVCLFWHCWWQ